MKPIDKILAMARVLTVSVLDFVCGPVLLYVMHSRGMEVLRVTDAGQYPGKFFLQALLLSAFPLLLFLLLWLLEGNQVLENNGLKVKGRAAVITVSVLVGLLAVQGIMAGLRTGEPVTVALALLYYVFFVGLEEEFIFRSVCPRLLAGFSWQVQYLVPSLLFALEHILAYNGFQPLTMPGIWDFARYELPGLMASGCCFLILRVRFGSLWVPVLLHGILNAMILFS